MFAADWVASWAMSRAAVRGLVGWARVKGRRRERVVRLMRRFILVVNSRQ